MLGSTGTYLYKDNTTNSFQDQHDCHGQCIDASIVMHVRVIFHTVTYDGVISQSHGGVLQEIRGLSQLLRIKNILITCGRTELTPASHYFWYFFKERTSITFEYLRKLPPAVTCAIFCSIKNSLKGQFIWFLISHFTPIVSCALLNSDTYLHTTSSITQEYSTWVLYIVFLSNVIVFLPALSHFFSGTLSYVLIVWDFDCFVVFFFFFF